VAILSFILPGLGHLRLGLRRRGLVLLVPTLAAVVALVALAGGGLLGVLETLIRPEVLVAVLVVDVGILGTRIIAIVDAYRTAERRSTIGIPYRPMSIALVAVLLAGTFLIHGAVAAVDFAAYRASTSIFVEPGNDNEWAIPSFRPTPSPTPYVSDPGIVPPPTLRPVEGTPTAAPDWANDGRLDLLLIGSDAGPGRWSLRTDTMIVLSVDVRTAHAALFGVPRNLIGVPLPAESAGAFPGGRYPGLINSLYVYAMSNPSQFPGGEARGFRAVSGAIQELLGLPLDGAVVVSLNGFVKLVNALGGLWIDVPSRVIDDHYPLENGSGHIYVDIKPGCQLLKGRLALAYARSRHQSDDYSRMRRQQTVLIALAHQVDPIALLPRVTELLDIASDNLWMTLRREDIRSLAALAAKVEPGRIRAFQFSPPTYPEFLSTKSIATIRDVAASVFDDWVSSTPSGTPAPSPESCPRG
jgi:LCP family protein required for cell wall assembly